MHCFRRYNRSVTAGFLTLPVQPRYTYLQEDSRDCAKFDMTEAPTPTTCPLCGGPLHDDHCAACNFGAKATSEQPVEKMVSLRTIRGWLIGCLLILILISISLYVWLARDYWESRTPTIVLMWLMDPSRRGVVEELRNRLEAGTLSDNHAEKILRQSIDEPRFVIATPFPADAEQFAAINIPIRISKKRWAVDLDDLNLMIDGEPVEQPRYMRKRMSVNKDPFGGIVRIPPLKGGSYELSVNGTLVISDRDAPEESRERLRHAFSASRTLKIEGAMEDCVHLTATREQLAEMGERLAACMLYWDLGGKENHYQLFISGQNLPIAISASVWVRARGTFDYYRIGTFVTPPVPSKIARFRKSYVLENIPRLDRTRALEIRFVPHMPGAIDRNIKKCFNGVIGWSYVDVRRVPRGSSRSIYGPWAYPDEVTTYKMDAEATPDTDISKQGI